MNLQNMNAVSGVLRKTDLTHADLSHSLLIKPNFFRAKVHEAAVHHTVFLGGDLVRTSFKGSDLSDCALIGVDAEEADFEGANLRNAGLVSSDLQNASFRNANLENTRLAALDVSGADFTDAKTTGARAYHVNWKDARVPPQLIPAPFIELPKWAWSALIGGFIGVLSILIYALIRRKKQPDS